MSESGGGESSKRKDGINAEYGTAEQQSRWLK